MQKLRAVLGLAALLWVNLAYNLFGSVHDVLDDRTEQWYVSVELLAVVMPVYLTVMAIAAHASVRRRLLCRMVRPLGALAALIAAVVSLWYLVRLDVPNASLSSLAAVAFALWLFPFILTGVVLSLVHIFRTADVHETVPPLLTTTIVWTMSLIDTLTGTYSEAPARLQAVLILSGPLTVTAVAVWELRRLSTLHGITIRQSLGRHPANDT